MQRTTRVLFALVATCTVIMQLWLSCAIFYNSFKCREVFSNGNTTSVNQESCLNSLPSIQVEWHCECRAQMAVLNVWIRVFDDASVAFASILFIFVIGIEGYRSSKTFYFAIIYDDLNQLTSLEFDSVIGLLSMILNPAVLCQNTIFYNAYQTMATIPDFLCLGVIYQYCSAIGVPVYNDALALTALILSCCDILRCFISIRMIKEHRWKIQQDKLMHQPPNYDAVKD